MTSGLSIRLFGDPVLRMPSMPVEVIDTNIVQLAQDMTKTMYAYDGVGVAAPQVGVSKAMFVYDEGNGPHTVINPVIEESSGSWSHDEGCLSVPGLYFDVMRSEYVRVSGLDIEGNSVVVEGNELLAKILQHEIDHLRGTLLLSHLDSEQRKHAMRELRNRQLK